MTDFLTSKILKQIAREQLLGKYPVTACSYFVMQTIPFSILYFASAQTSTGNASLFIYYSIYFIVLLLNAILLVGQDYMYLRIARTNECLISDIWYGIKNVPDKAIGIQFVRILLYLCCAVPLYILLYLMRSTGSRLYLVPCLLALVFFLAGYSWFSLLFSQAFYLLIDHPQEKCIPLMRQSIDLMKGHKRRLFSIWISFCGMYLLVLIIMGLGILWVHPYFQMVRANFYHYLVKKANKRKESQAT